MSEVSSTADLSRASSFEELLERIPFVARELQQDRELLLANLAMIAEIPAPTFGEGRRQRFLRDRFTECGLQQCSMDEAGNCVGVLPGTVGEDNILVVAHADTVFPAQVDHTIQMQMNQVVGPGVGDNSLGLAVIATLPTLLEQLGVRPCSNLILMGAARSLGRGNLEGLRFFLANNQLPIRAGISVEGVQLGRLSYKSAGMVRAELTCTVPELYDWERFGSGSAIAAMNEVVNKINEIPLPRRPRTSIILGAIHGGTSFNRSATNVTLRFEVRSQSAETVQEVHSRIDEIAAEVSSETGAAVDLNVFARRRPGGIQFTHPLARCTRRIMKALEIKPRMAPSISELSAFIDHTIPAVTLGITTGDRHHKTNERIRIPPMFTGLTQLIAVLLAVDGDHCNGAEGPHPDDHYDKH